MVKRQLGENYVNSVNSILNTLPYNKKAILGDQNYNVLIQKPT